MPNEQEQIDELKREVDLFSRHDHNIAGGERLRTDLMNIDDSDVTMSDVTTGDVSSTKHGFAPKSPADDTMYLDGAATPAYKKVRDSDLSLSDIGDNNVSAARHGFCPIVPDDDDYYLRGDAIWSPFPTVGIALTKGTIPDNSNVTTSTGDGTNTDSDPTAHGLGKTPKKITISATVYARGNPALTGGAHTTLQATAIFDSSGVISISGVGWYSIADNTMKNDTTLVPPVILLSGIQAFSAHGYPVGGTANYEEITISLVSIGATYFTFRINGVLAGADCGSSSVTNISWICEA